MSKTKPKEPRERPVKPQPSRKQLVREKLAEQMDRPVEFPLREPEGLKPLG